MITINTGKCEIVLVPVPEEDAKKFLIRNNEFQNQLTFESNYWNWELTSDDTPYIDLPKGCLFDIIGFKNELTEDECAELRIVEMKQLRDTTEKEQLYRAYVDGSENKIGYD